MDTSETKVENTADTSNTIEAESTGDTTDTANQDTVENNYKAETKCSAKVDEMTITSSRQRTMDAIGVLGSNEKELIGKLIVIIKQKLEDTNAPNVNELKEIGYLSEIIEVYRYDYRSSIKYKVVPKARVTISKIIGCMALCKIVSNSGASDGKDDHDEYTQMEQEIQMIDQFLQE